MIMTVVLNLKDNLNERIERLLTLRFKIRGNLISQFIDTRMTVGCFFQKIFHTSVFIRLTFIHYIPMSRSVLFTQYDIHPWSRSAGMDVKNMTG